MSIHMPERARDAARAIEQSIPCEFSPLSVNQEGAGPYQIPLCVVVSGEVIYFHTCLAGKAGELLAKDSRASLSAVTWTERDPEHFTLYFRSAHAEGTVHEVDDYDEKYEAILRFGAKYLQNDRVPCMAERIAGGRARVYRFTPSVMTGKEHTAP